MKKIFGKVLLVYCMFVLLQVCFASARPMNHDNNSERTFDVHNFRAFHYSGIWNVGIVQTENGGYVKAYGSKESVDNVKVDVDNGILKIYFKNKSKSEASELKIVIGTSILNEVKSSGIGSINFVKPYHTNSLSIIDEGVGSVNIGELETDTLSIKTMAVGNVSINRVKTDSLVVSSMGVGNVHIGIAECISSKFALDAVGGVTIDDLRGNHVKIVSNGMGNITLKGKISYAKMMSDGAGHINAGGLQAHNVDVRSYGVGNVNCCATYSIIAIEEGKGDIKYTGAPSEKYLEKTGLGRIMHY